jgi:hypothetical protein
MGLKFWTNSGSRKVTPQSDEAKPYLWVFLILIVSSAAFVAAGGTTDRQAIASSMASLAVPDTERAPPVAGAARAASQEAPDAPAAPVATVPARPAPKVSESGAGPKPAIAETGTVSPVASAEDTDEEPALETSKKLRKRSIDARPKRARKAPLSVADNGIRGRLASSAVLRDEAGSRRTRSTIDLF